MLLCKQLRLLQCIFCRLIGLEQTVESTPLPLFAFPDRTCLVLGREQTGIPPQVICRVFAVLRQLQR